MFLVFRKTQLFAINKAWIKLSLGEDTLFHVIFVVEYQFLCWNFVFSGYLENLSFTNMSSIMFSITMPLCNITWKLQIMTIFVQWIHYIPFDRFHDEL